MSAVAAASVRAAVPAVGRDYCAAPAANPWYTASTSMAQATRKRIAVNVEYILIIVFDF
jgi:hypothetical protein